MYYSGCDIGSLTAKAVILDDNGIVSSALIRVKGTALSSASEVMDRALESAGIRMEDFTSPFPIGTSPKFPATA